MGCLGGMPLLVEPGESASRRRPHLEAGVTGSSFFSVEKVVDGRSGGTTQAESRIYNERLIVSLVRRHGQLSKADLTRLTGLAPQTITTIVNRIAENDLLVRREPLRGRLGQPSVPYALNPAGAYAFGLRIGSHAADLVLVDFVGEVVGFEQAGFAYPAPDEVMAFARAAVARLLRKSRAEPGRIAGLGIASPFYQWNGEGGAMLPAAALRAWREIDIRAELDGVFAWPVYLLNDAVVAAGAELMFGAGLGRADFLYVYIGQLLGGGLVLDHHLFPGRNRLAGALGAVPVPAGGNSGAWVPLAEVASLSALGARLPEADARRLAATPEDWGPVTDPVAGWIEEVGDGLATAFRSAVALLDVDNVVVDGALPPAIRKEIAKATRRKLARAFLDRPEPFSVIEGHFGPLAPAIGGASIPLLVKYSNDKELLFKD